VRILVYEFATGGGLFALRGSMEESTSWLREGQAMVHAVAEDFAALDDCQVLVFRDARLDASTLPPNAVPIESAHAEEDQLRRISAQVDGVVLIAPEMDGLLLQRIGWIENGGARLLSPGSEFCQLAACKRRTADWLAAGGIRVPNAAAWRVSESFPDTVPFPLVIKPPDGAGAVDTFRCDTPADVESVRGCRREWRVEAFCDGLAASVSVLAGPDRTIVLPPCAQRLSRRGSIGYLGGRLPLPDVLAARARRLGEQVVRRMPKTTGYFGIDLVLGPAESGERDFVLEVNPRYTTSYVGLRRAAPWNLAEILCRLVRGEPAPLPDRYDPVEFDADGTVRRI